MKDFTERDDLVIFFIKAFPFRRTTVKVAGG